MLTEMAALSAHTVTPWHYHAFEEKWFTKPGRQSGLAAPDSHHQHR